MTSAGMFRALDREWHEITARTIEHPWPDDSLPEYRTLDELIARIRAGATDPAGTDRILAVLARRAPTDMLAARTLLQAVLPGLWNVAKRLGHGRVDDELEAEVLAEAIERIRTYPIERRPRAVAANITWDVFGRITRRRHRPEPVTVELTIYDVPAAADEDPSRQVCDLVTDALHAGHLRRTDADLLLAIAVGAETIRTRAHREGVTYGAMCERWCRARTRLRRAAAA